jgi:purine-cytosine permease-like protein
VVIVSGSRAWPRLAWFRDCGDYEGVVIVLVLVAAGAAIWWQVGHKRWGAVGRLVFWVVLLAVVWVLVSLFGPPHPAG